MAKKVNPSKRPIEQYEGKDKERSINPLLGFVPANKNRYKNKKTYQFNFQIHAFKETISLPFEAEKYNRVAVKIVDDRGIEIEEGSRK
ncbi:MAG: hypothetical protein WCS69_14955 [Ignavibacteriaceae bacterium]|jgi:hypothetical protein